MSIFSLNIYKYPQHQYYHHQLKYHRHIRIMQSFSYNQLKFFLKHFLKIMELHFLRIFRFKFAYFNMMNNYINIRPIIMQTKTKVLTLLSKIYRFFFSAVKVGQFYTCIGLLSRITFFSLSGCTDVFICAPNIMTFLPNPLLPDNQNLHVHKIQSHSQNIYTYQDHHLQSSQKSQIKKFITKKFY